MILDVAWKGKYIQFLDAGWSASGKTKIWNVATIEDVEDLLGEIRWFTSWRCYAFYPYNKTVYEKTCLRDIATFCERVTGYYYNIKKKTRTGVNQRNE